MFCHIKEVAEFTYDGEPLVWVDGNTEEAGVGVDQLILVPNNRVPEDTGIPEVGEVSHVSGAVVDGRVHLTHLVLLEHLLLLADHHGGLLAVLGLKEALQVATFSLVRVGHPNRLLSIVRLGLVDNIIY